MAAQSQVISVRGKTGAMRVVGFLLIHLVLFMTLDARAAQAHDALPHGTSAVDMVGFDQRLNRDVPDELRFRDESGQSVEIGSYWGEKPVILALSYFECETLCPLVRHGLVEALRPLTFVAGEEFDVVLVSIDPEESAATATAVKAETMESYGRSGGERGWHFLTGDHESIDRLAEAIGFRYAYDGEQDEYAHASGVVILTPKGEIARYFFGIEYVPQDLRLGLVEASQNRIGSAIDQLLLLCYHYDPTVGKYSLVIMSVLRIAGAVTVMLMALLIFMLWRRDAQKQRSSLLG
jgi:protein SCO1/2